MAEEYRIDISLGATDNTGPAFQSASKRVSAFEKSMQRTEKQLNRMDRTRWELTVHAVDRASSVIMAINRRALGLTRGAFTITLRAVDYATRPIRAVGNLLTSTLGLLGAAGGTWAGVVYPLQLSGEFEQTQIAFETMLGDAERARQFLAEAQQFAVRTPFEMADVLNSSRLLMAFGFQVERVLPMLETIGDTTAGLGAGADGIERITRALGQMQAKGRVQAEELLQLQELGVPAAEILQEELGLTAEQVANIGEQSIESARVIEALLRGMDKRFGGLMDKQSKSWSGLLSTIKDTLNTRLLMRWGDGLRMGLQPHLQRLADWFDENQATIERWGSTLEETGRRAADWVAQKFQGVYQWIQDVMASPEWQEAEGPWEHLQVLWDAWWTGGGETWVHETGSKIGQALKTGVQAGFGTLSDIFWGIQGTAGGTILDAWLLAQFAPALWITGKAGSKVWGWLRGLGGGAATAAKTASTVAPEIAGAAAGVARTVPIYGPNGEILATVAQSADDVARAAATGSRLLSGLRGVGSFLGRWGGPIGALLGTGLGLIGIGSAEDKGAYIGSAVGGGLGGWGGAVGGAALGSMIAPGLGTVIGGIIGGLGGGWGGSKLGEWLGDMATPDNEPISEPVTAASTGTTPVVVQVEVSASPQYQIETAVDADEVISIIERNQRRLAEILGDELVDELTAVFSNLPLNRGRAPIYATARIAEF